MKKKLIINFLLAVLMMSLFGCSKKDHEGHNLALETQVANGLIINKKALISASLQVRTIGLPSQNMKAGALAMNSPSFPDTYYMDENQTRRIEVADAASFKDGDIVWLFRKVTDSDTGYLSQNKTKFAWPMSGNGLELDIFSEDEYIRYDQSYKNMRNIEGEVRSPVTIPALCEDISIILQIKKALPESYLSPRGIGLLVGDYLFRGRCYADNGNYKEEYVVVYNNDATVKLVVEYNVSAITVDDCVSVYAQLSDGTIIRNTDTTITASNHNT